MTLQTPKRITTIKSAKEHIKECKSKIRSYEDKKSKYERRLHELLPWSVTYKWEHGHCGSIEISEKRFETEAEARSFRDPHGGYDYTVTRRTTRKQRNS